MFRELISTQEGDAHPDDKHKEDNAVNKKSAMADHSEGFVWCSTRDIQVRKSRTSIVRSEMKKGSPTGETSLKQSHSPKGQRKRLKLAKPSKRNTGNEETELSNSYVHSSPLVRASQSSEPKERSFESDSRIAPMDKICPGSAEGCSQEITEENRLKGRIIPDSYDGTQINAGQEHSQVEPLPSNLSSENKNQFVEPTLDGIACQPMVRLSELRDFEDCLREKQKSCIDLLQRNDSNIESNSTYLDSSTAAFAVAQLSNIVASDCHEVRIQDLCSSIQPAVEVKLENAVVPDSYDIKSQDWSLSTQSALKFQLKNVVVPDSFDMEILKEAPLVSQNALVNFEPVLEHASGICHKSDSFPSQNVKEESQSSEGNTQRGDSDSLGQELAKSMISLLLPQALQMYCKKGRKRKKGIPLTVNEEQKIDLDSAAMEVSAVDKEESNDCADKVRDFQTDDDGHFSAAHDNSCKATHANQVQSVEEVRSDKSLDTVNELLEICPEVCIGNSNDIEEHLSTNMTEFDSCKMQQSDKMSTYSKGLADDIHRDCQQAQKGTDNHAMRCSTISCNDPIAADSPVLSLTKRPEANECSVVSQPSIPAISSLSVEEQREQADGTGVQNLKTEGIGSLALKFPSIVGPKVSFVETRQIEEEIVTLSSKASSPLTKGLPKTNIDVDATQSPSKSPSRPVYGEAVTSVAHTLTHDEVQQNHPVNSVALLGPLGHQVGTTLTEKEVEFCQQLPAEKRTSDDFVVEEEWGLLTKTFVPKICLEHPMPVLVMKITFQDDQARLLVCCGHQDATRMLFLYQIAGKECLPSIIGSMKLEIMDYNFSKDRRGLVENSGLHFTPGGHNLLLLGMFELRQATEETHLSQLSQKEKSLGDIQVVAFTAGKICIVCRLITSSVNRLYSVLPVDTCTLIAGGENGFIIGWTMDASWRSCKENFMLPQHTVDIDPSSSIIKLSEVPNLPSIVVGCDNRGLIAIWNFVSRRLLRSLKLSLELPWELHILNMYLFGKNDCGLETDDRNNVIASIFVSTLSDQATQTQESTGQSGCKTWRLNLFRKDGTSTISNLDQLQQRILTVEVSETLALAGTKDGRVLLWDKMSGSVMGTLKQPTDEPVGCIAIDRACNMISAAGGVHVVIYGKLSHGLV